MHDNIPEKCQECKLVSLESGYSFEQKEDGSVKYTCFACAYDRDVHEQLSTGILRSSLASKSLIKQDWKIFKPHFELEVMMTPLFKEIWNKYKNHETLNDPKLKRAIIIDLTGNKIYSRTWGESSKDILKDIPINTSIIEIFDGMCGYIGIDLYSAHSDHGMWIQGQLRSKDSLPWYRSCYCTMEYANTFSNELEKFLNIPENKIKSEQLSVRYELKNTYRLP